ncbi:RNA polymerase sigma-70 factor [Microbispora sp. NPDC049125]|uniref:RNA polymerase sigma-70 factor n=1 Tax=Microbispora sp. NPDC049125 TaxID=3154929 RepID=UPI003466693E
MTADVFTEHRGLLTGVAYRILGSVADAEDVVQEAWLRWADVDASAVADPKAYLVRVTTNLSIDRLRRAQARREAYVGPWLPEPIVTSPDAAERAELAETVEMALLVVLETLSPLERAVFVLREAFGFTHAEIAQILGRGEPAVRQLARRARDHVREGRPRFDVDRRERREVTERFAAACAEGDMEGLTALLAGDVHLVGDGGGKVRAPLRELSGAGPVTRFLAAIASDEGRRRFMVSLGASPSLEMELEIAELNGGPAIVAWAGGRAITVISLVVVDGVIQTIYLIANPDKMSRIAGPDPSGSA